jgi:RNA polymerase sigma-70 factor, ECF subfamily
VQQAVQENETRWVEQAQKGSAEAFTQLVELHQRHVFNLCFRMLGNAEDAEDAAQETFLRAYKSMRRYDNSRSFSTWLLSIAAHYCIDQMRRNRTPLVSVEDMTVPDLPDPGPGLETGLSRREEQQRIRALLDTLEPVDRAAVIMYYWYDFSYEEICQALSLSLSAVKSRLHRARRAMAERWAGDRPDGLTSRPDGSGNQPDSQPKPQPAQPIPVREPMRVGRAVL